MYYTNFEMHTANIVPCSPKMASTHYVGVQIVSIVQEN